MSTAAATAAARQMLKVRRTRPTVCAMPGWHAQHLGCREMSIETEEELEALRAAGRVVAEALRAMRRQVRPGVTTAELDEVGARVFRRAGARSGPQLDYGFPGVNCISVNDEAVH